MIVGQGLTLTALGLTLGLAAGVVAARAIRSLLFGVSELDPITYAGVLLLMLTVCVLACWLPALRAVRIEPSTALRSE